MTDIIITLSNQFDVVRQCIIDGFYPIGFDEVSLRRGHIRKRAAIALDAYRDHFGDGAMDKKFVVCGPADAASCFAIAAYLGEVPHPLQRREFASGLVLDQMGKKWDFSLLAETIDVFCCHLKGRKPDISKLPFGELLSDWNRHVVIVNNVLGLHTGVGTWREICCRHPTILDEISENEYDESDALKNAGDIEFSEEPQVLFVRNVVTKDFNKWYYKAPVVVGHWEQSGMVKLACRNEAIAKRFLGDGGLTKVFPVLNEKLPQCSNDEWGGRISVGGSPCYGFSVDEARFAAKIVVSFMKNIVPPQDSGKGGGTY